MESSGQILIVDDEPQVRDLTRRALTAGGFSCDSAADGLEALQMAVAGNYDAVVTDLRMPQHHGHGLCTDLLKLPNPPRIIVLTALSDPRLSRDLMGRGVYDVVNKPVNYDMLTTKVQAMLLSGKSNAAQPKKKAFAKKATLLNQIETMLVELTEGAGERLDEVFDWPAELPDPPRAVRDFIRRLAENEVLDGEKPTAVVMPGHEGRKAERVTCYTTVVAVPVDRDWQRVGEPSKLALRDLSEGGVRMLYTRATNAQYLALGWNATQLPGKQIRVVCSVRRCQPCGPFYDIGGQFMMAD